MILHSVFSTKYQSVSDRQTGRQTDSFSVANKHRQPRLKQPEDEDGSIVLDSKLRFAFSVTIRISGCIVSVRSDSTV